jgi:GntR family negative regulator for fad regulon and positive regulator of fabA
MNRWHAPLRPNAYAEQMLLEGILDGTFPPGSNLPGERTLAVDLGVTRPTLREALQRLARDGWVTVQQGKATVVNDYWQEGGLNVLSALVQHSAHLPQGFVTQLLQVRLQLAPAYTEAAVQRQPARTAILLENHQALPDTPQSYAAFDWQLHHGLTIASSNPIYAMIMNGFAGFYEDLAQVYFIPEESRLRSHAFYAELEQAVQAENAALARQVIEMAMRDSITLWQRARAAGSQSPASESGLAASQFWR